MGPSRRPTMKTVHQKSKIVVPDDCEVKIKSRTVQVKGPRGTLTKSFKHMSVDLYMADAKTIMVEKWFGTSKELAIIKTVSSHITNLFIGVTKGFKYRMKMVYAHFPTNVQINGKGDALDVVNFIGQKVKFHIDALEGVKMERDPKSNQDILISGNDVENVSRTCALINQACAVKNKDIRKFLDGIYVSQKGHIVDEDCTSTS